MSTVTIPDAPATLTAALPPEVGYLRYLTAVTMGIAPVGQLVHSIHSLDHVGSQLPWTPFADVATTAGEAGSIVDSAIRFAPSSTGVLGTHVVAVDGDGGLRRTFRARGSETWEPWEDVKAKAGSNPGHFVRVTMGLNRGLLHICGLTDDGLLWHTIRRDDGTYEPFFDIASAAGDLVDPIQVGCHGYGSTPADGLALFVVTNDGRVWSTSRRESDGTWSPFIDIRRPGRAGNPGRFVDIDCHPQSGERELHVTGITDDGRLWYAVRRDDSTWKKVFTDVAATAGDKGTFISAAMAMYDVVGATSDGGLWLTNYDRRTDKFEPFQDVAAEAGRMGVYTSVALHSMMWFG